MEEVGADGVALEAGGGDGVRVLRFDVGGVGLQVARGEAVATAGHGGGGGGTRGRGGEGGGGARGRSGRKAAERRRRGGAFRGRAELVIPALIEESAPGRAPPRHVLPSRSRADGRRPPPPGPAPPYLVRGPRGAQRVLGGLPAFSRAPPDADVTPAAPSFSWGPIPRG